MTSRQALINNDNKTEEIIDEKPAETEIIDGKPAEIIDEKPVEIIDEKTPEIIIGKPVYNDRTEDRVECPDCKKIVSKKTLRYTHKYQCPARVKPEPTTIETEDPPAPIRTKRTRENVAAPATPTIMQTTYMRKPSVQRYEHINLF